MFKYLQIFIVFLIFQLVPFPRLASDTLIVLPEERSEGIQENDSFISLIDRAEKEILLASYKLQAHKLPQKDLLDALKRASERGVAIHLIAESRLSDVEILRESDEIRQGDALNAYQQRGVHVYSGCGNFNQSHTKFIIVDHKEAILGNTNFDKDPEGVRSLQPPARDFAVYTKNVQLIDELVAGFWGDILDKEFVKKEMNLLWGPEKQRENLYELIENAQYAIRIYQQDITDTGIMEKLIRAVERGVSVELIMSPYPFGKNNPDNNTVNQQALVNVGGVLHLSDTVSIHAKVMIIDDATMYLGSTNFFQPAIDQNRNVGLLTQDPELIEQVLHIFQKDKQG